ncbi:MAG: hypothetical protein AW08_01835 [Candidatus Accumulibacter adjunctus]|uniref:PepSY domain-containing protein n=1 Tax=Candidatus Accumulibacter adjunctus TaxID=1454001 RepID=A0A011PMM2_9PROT|nr:MAG: hypothetical protein AW08_01835 [Candidatus Accumulibacter adjunctus]
MRKPKLLSSLVLAATLASGAFVRPAIAGDARSASATAGAQWLPLGEIVRRLEAAGYRDIEKIEREHGAYEARATDRDGARVKLDIQPMTGHITPRASRSDRREGARSQERAVDGARAQECTKRRCRDDLPTPPVAPAPAPAR